MPRKPKGRGVTPEDIRHREGQSHITLGRNIAWQTLHNIKLTKIREQYGDSKGGLQGMWNEYGSLLEQNDGMRRFQPGAEKKFVEYVRGEHGLTEEQAERAKKLFITRTKISTHRMKYATLPVGHNLRLGKILDKVIRDIKKGN